ncbi:hypothetical protein GE21DRAFT_1279923 [Neurospora crassa]|nr:hypothetical protein GE21DRAFT_1279923 [Neurospora crassa]
MRACVDGRNDGRNDTTDHNLRWEKTTGGLEGDKIPAIEGALVCMYASLVGLWVIHSAAIGVRYGNFFLSNR